MNAMILKFLKTFSLDFPIEIFHGDFSFSSNILILSKVLSSISNELNKFYNFETFITEINDDKDKVSLFIEISGLLREMGCPYLELLDKNMETRFSTEYSIKLILWFFLSEIAAARIIAIEYPNNAYIARSIDSTEDNLTSIMKPALISLGIGRPPENMNTRYFFDKLKTGVENQLPLIPKYLIGKSLLPVNKKFSKHEWNQVDIIINDMNTAYSLRRQTLLQRLDVTLQSFMWSVKANKQKDNINKIKSSKRPILESSAFVTLIDLLAARDYPFALINKTSSGISREYSACKLNKHKIGPVPDRGGRTNEMEAPPPEMPAFQKRDSNSSQNRGGGFQNHSDNSRQTQSNVGNHKGKSFDSYENQKFSQNVAPINFYEQSRNFTPVFQNQGRDVNYSHSQYYPDRDFNLSYQNSGHDQFNRSYSQNQYVNDLGYNNQNQDNRHEFHQNRPNSGRGRGRGRDYRS